MIKCYIYLCGKYATLTTNISILTSTDAHGKWKHPSAACAYPST